MWLREPIPIEVSRNASTPIGLQLWDDIGKEPIDITGFTVTCNVSDVDGITKINSPTVTISSAKGGEFDITFKGADYSAVQGTQEWVVLSYEVKCNDGGASVIAMRGPLILVPGIA